MISWRDFNQIWKIDSRSGEIIWKYGAESIQDDNERFYKQHGIHRNMDGDYMLFDNGNARTRKTTRAVGFKEQNGEILNTLIISLPDSLFTFKQGNVTQFEDNRFLFNSTTTKTLIVTNRSGEILWLAKSDNAFYKAYVVNKNILK